MTRGEKNQKEDKDNNIFKFHFYLNKKDGEDDDNEINN